MLKKPNRTIITTTVLLAVVCSCSEKTEVISSQHEPNWTSAAPEALTSAASNEGPEINAATYLAAGQLFERQGATNKAIMQYRQCLAKDPNSLAALCRLGVLYSKSGLHEFAEQAFKRATEIRPDQAQLFNNLGYEYLLQNRWADAEGQFRRALDIDREFRRARNNLAMALTKQGRYEEALGQFQAILPEADAYYNLGLMYRTQRMFPEAAAAFEEALQRNPSFAAAKQQLRQIQPQLGIRLPADPALGRIQTQQAIARTDKPVLPRVVEPARIVSEQTAPQVKVAPMVATAPAESEPVVVAPVRETIQEIQTVESEPVITQHDVRPQIQSTPIQSTPVQSTRVQTQPTPVADESIEAISVESISYGDEADNIHEDDTTNAPRNDASPAAEDFERLKKPTTPEDEAEEDYVALLHWSLNVLQSARESNAKQDWLASLPSPAAPVAEPFAMSTLPTPPVREGWSIATLDLRQEKIEAFATEMIEKIMVTCR